MQIRSDFTKEKLMKDSDPLALTCHPLGKIKMLADFFWCVDKQEFETGTFLIKTT